MNGHTSHNHRKMLIIAAVLLLLTAAFIFLMSSRDVDESLRDSSGFDRMLAHLVVDGFDEMGPEEQQAAALALDEPIRHIAHTAEFFALGALLTLICILIGIPVWIAWAAGTLYGVLDEVHQLFVSGRGCQISDMAFDALGALLGLITVLIIAKAGRRG